MQKQQRNGYKCTTFVSEIIKKGIHFLVPFPQITADKLPKERNKVITFKENDLAKKQTNNKNKQTVHQLKASCLWVRRARSPALCLDDKWIVSPMSHTGDKERYIDTLMEHN